MLFGEKLKRIRIENGWTQEELAQKLGTSKQVISRYENNQRTPIITIAAEYAKVLNVSVDFLINNTIEHLEQNRPTVSKDPLIMDTIYDRIKIRRQELGMSQDELAKRLGYTSRSTINKIESGLIDIPQSNVIAFASALSVTPAHLVGWDQPPINNPVSATHKKNNLTSKEQDLLLQYNMLDDIDQASVIGYIESKLEHEKYKKITSTSAC